MIIRFHRNFEKQIKKLTSNGQTKLKEKIIIFMADEFNPILNNQLIYAVLYFILVVLFTYFYTSITFEPKEVALNLQRSSGFVPGIRPGEPTKEYLESIVNKITLFGSVFLGLIAILPLVIQYFANTNILTIGGTTLLIVVSVALDSMRQIDSQLVMREYEVV